ncbi:MAG TPA: glycerate kinase, partial [Chloroflexota bacterium]|nr:glycerate kinase [Chloroflexota bacterium]
HATWGLLGGSDTAVIEMAAASGLPLIRRDQRNPMRTTTYGTGELIRAALDSGARRLIVGIGGSATNDGGAGMAQALGVRLLDANRQELRPGGANLVRLDRIDTSGLDPRVGDLEVEVACDVNNPLVGPTGASYVYGPQKGADQHMVCELDAALERYADVIQRDLGPDLRDVPGAGAAGGTGAGLIAFLGARLRPGVEIVFEALEFERRSRGADLVITGEGKMDRQDLFGKAPIEVARRARALQIPCIAVVGSTGRDYHVLYEHGIDAVIGTTNRPMSIERAVSESSRLISEAGMRAARLIRVGETLARRHDPTPVA